MAYLTAIDPVQQMTPVEIYGIKQKKWANAQDSWDQAKIDAQSKSHIFYV
jgi:hypothetical protein